MTAPHDPVNHPRHYTDVVPGIECIDVVEHMTFLRGNAIKYLWRAGTKGDTVTSTIEDLKKARWYIEREIANLEASVAPLPAKIPPATTADLIVDERYLREGKASTPMPEVES